VTVLFINSTRKWGGVKTWILDYGRALRARGHRVVAVVRPGTPFEQACRSAGFGTYAFRLGPKYSPAGVLRVVRVLRRERPDVVVVNISKDINVGAVAAKLVGIPVVHRIGLVEDFKDSWEERLWHRYLVDRAVVPSRYLRDRLVKAFPWFDAGRLVVVPNSKFAGEQEAARPDEPADPVVFGVTSQLSPSKGHSFLLQACEILEKRGLSFRLRIAGTGRLETALRSECKRRGIERLVEFVGFRNPIGPFLGGLHGFVLPSLGESFSNAVLEAMWAGLPVVAFRAGGVPEVVGPAGILVPPKDAEALAEAMERLLRDPDLRGELGRRARERAEREYSVEHNVVRLERVFREAGAR